MRPNTGLTQLSLPMFETVQEVNSDMSMSSSAASRAKTYHMPERVLDWKANALVYGGSSHDLLAKLDPALLCWKMCQLSLRPDVVAQKSLRRLPKWGMTRSGALYRLPMSGLRTNVSGGFVWATATAHDYQNRQPPPEDKTHITLSGTLKLDTGHKSHVNLGQQVKYYEQKQDWHTPIANDALKAGAIEQKRENGLSAQVQWATPTVNTSKNNASPSQWKRNSSPLDVQVQASMHKVKPLNPEWVEMLMGFPVGWTEVD